MALFGPKQNLRKHLPGPWAAGICGWRHNTEPLISGIADVDDVKVIFCKICSRINFVLLPGMWQQCAT